MRSLGEPWFERSCQELCTRVSLTYGQAKLALCGTYKPDAPHAPKTETKTTER